MKLTLNRYAFLLSLQLGFLAVDIFLNTFAQYLFRDKFELIILSFIIQDIFIVCEYLFFTLALHSTCVHEVGASHVILRNSKFFLIAIVSYFLLSTTQHFWIVYNALWATPATNWPTALNALSFVQRMVSFVYYYICKRTAYTIVDPRYLSIDWIAEQLTASDDR